MADIKRKSEALWTGDVRGGKGQISTASGVLKETAYSFGTRFENGIGTNPEELLAAAHAACFSMALTATLGRKGHAPESIHTEATCVLSPQQPSGFKVTKMILNTRGRVPGIDQETFKSIAAEAEQGCPISNALRSVEIELNAELEG